MGTQTTSDVAKPPVIVSFGGGVNSTAMLVGLADCGLRPDAILFADTGGEKPETYEHIAEVREWCKTVDMPPIEVVSYSTSRHGSLELECLNNETLPSKAFGFGGCSVKWKRQPMDRWVNAWQPAIDAWERGQKVVRLIGIHAGEVKRGKIPDDDKFTYRYPLRVWRWGQTECIEAIKRAGLSVPVKSACFFCPAMKKAEVLKLKAEHPELYQRAIEMEKNAAEAGNLETVRGLGRNWTWEELGQADDEQLKLFSDLQAPLCDVCMEQ